MEKFLYYPFNEVRRKCPLGRGIPLEGHALLCLPLILMLRCYLRFSCNGLCYAFQRGSCQELPGGEGGRAAGRCSMGGVAAPGCRYEEVALLWLGGPKPPKRGMFFSAQAVPCSCSGCGGDSTDKRVCPKTMQVTSQAKQKTLVLGQEKSFFNQVGGSGLLQAMLLWKGSRVPAALKPAALALLPCPAACFLQASVESVPLKLT